MRFSLAKIVKSVGRASGFEGYFDCRFVPLHPEDGIGFPSDFDGTHFLVFVLKFVEEFHELCLILFDFHNSVYVTSFVASIRKRYVTCFDLSTSDPGKICVHIA